MKNVLFENVGGNQFKLLKESVTKNESLVSSGIKKVFMNAGVTPVSYNRIEAVGMGYIKDISEAKQIALSEARILAKEFGYKDSEDDAKFVKDSSNTLPLKKEENEEKNMNNPSERDEVQIGKQILAVIQSDLQFDLHPSHEAAVEKIKALAEQLVKMHGQQ